MAAEGKICINARPSDVHKTINYPVVALQAMLRNIAERYPQKTVLVYGSKETSYSQLDLLSNQFAQASINSGIKEGDRVALFLPNIPQFIIAYFGVLKAGAVVTAISPLYREREVQYHLCDSGAQAVVALDSLFPVVDKVREKTRVKQVIVTDLSGDSAKLEYSSTTDFKRFISSGSKTAPKINLDPAEDLAALQYTGGTTGTAKAAMLTHSNLVSNALAFAAWIKGTPAQETFLTALPLFHIYGMTTSMIVPISLAAKIVLTSKFEPAKVLDTIQKHKVTVFCGVPTMYSTLLANSELTKYDLTSIRVCISGASSLPPQVQKRFMEVTGGFLGEGFGLTEASPVTHCTPVDKSMVKVGSIGLPLPDTEARIVDLETGKPLQVGETGELAVKGPQVMKGYWRRPEETELVLNHGWLLTGDIAYMDHDGYYYLTDRKKDLIKTKDFSVYPRELEDILYEHSAVQLCAVVGKPDPLAGEVPKAFVVLKDEVSVSAEELMVFVNGKVAFYKAIHELEFRKELPLSGAGKVLKRQLRTSVYR